MANIIFCFTKLSFYEIIEDSYGLLLSQFTKCSEKAIPKYYFEIIFCDGAGDSVDAGTPAASVYVIHCSVLRLNIPLSPSASFKICLFWEIPLFPLAGA